MARKSIVTLEIRCSANEDYFTDTIPDEVNAELIANGPIPCEGQGYLGYWCDECRFGRVQVVDSQQDEG
jgi:hypothetical protein